MDELNTPMVMPPEESIPDWYDGKRINEVLFCQQLLKKASHEMCQRKAVHSGWTD